MRCLYIVLPVARRRERKIQGAGINLSHGSALSLPASKGRDALNPPTSESGCALNLQVNGNIGDYNGKEI